MGVSPDDLSTQCKFAEKLKLPFPLIADHSKKICDAYGVSWALIDRIKRITFVIDGTGVVRDVFTYELRFGKHVTDAKASAKTLVRK